MDKVECLLVQQEAKLVLQGSLLRRQDLELSQHRTLLRQQGTDVSRLKLLLRRQNAHIRYQKTLLGQQERKLARQESLLLPQEKVLQRLGASKIHSHGGISELVPQLLLENVGDITNSLNSGALIRKEAMTSPSLNVTARSDDAGPLQAAVNQISQQVTEVSADVEALKNSNTQQDQYIKDARSATFIRWGSAQCDASSQLVYSGIVGGSFFEHPGAATNHLCLTSSPVLSSRNAPEPWLAYLYGSEYEMGDSHENLDIVCAVCRSTFSTTVMIPGTDVCIPGWHLHYSGYIMAGYFNHTAGSEYICVDSRLESSFHSEANQNGKMYFTVARCGSLPCPPYQNEKVVTCAVCGK